MKKIILLLTIVMAVVADAMAQNNAMYVYRNDGVINAFLKSEVDSMRYSTLDLDSVSHKDYVVQEVWTVDSTYRIPLSVIDSVSFVTPATKIKNDVENISDNLLAYIAGVDSLTIHLKQATPANVVPNIGTKLVFMEQTDLFPSGFAGRVNSIETQANSIDVICELTNLEEIFDSYCSITSTYGYCDEQNAQAKGARKIVINPDDANVNLGPYKISRSGEVSAALTTDGNLVMKAGTSFTVTLRPTLRIHTFLIIGEGQGTYFNCSITGKLETSAETSVYGGLEYNKDFYEDVNIPIFYKFVNFYIRPGSFIRASGTYSTTLSANRTYSFGMVYNYSSKDETTAHINFSVEAPQHDHRIISYFQKPPFSHPNILQTL